MGLWVSLKHSNGDCLTEMLEQPQISPIPIERQAFIFLFIIDS